MPGGAQRLPLAAGFRQHPVADRDDHAGFLGDGDEFTRLHQALLWIVPAHERFHAGHVA